MQYGQTGGFNNLALGSQGKSYININGSGDYIDLTNVNGGLRINGNAGSPGQVLQTNGNGAAPTWSSGSKPYVLTFPQTDFNQLVGTGVLIKNLLGMNNQFFTLQQASNIVFTGNLRIGSNNFVTASFGYMTIKIFDSNNQEMASAKAYGSSLDTRLCTISAIGTANLPAGIYHTQATFSRNSDLDGDMNMTEGVAIIQVFPN